MLLYEPAEFLQNCLVCQKMGGLSISVGGNLIIIQNSRSKGLSRMIWFQVSGVRKNGCQVSGVSAALAPEAASFIEKETCQHRRSKIGPVGAAFQPRAAVLAATAVAAGKPLPHNHNFDSKMTLDLMKFHMRNLVTGIWFLVAGHWLIGS